MFEELKELGYDLKFSHHADALIASSFQSVEWEISTVLRDFQIPLSSLVGSGGGVTKGTQRLRDELYRIGWVKKTIQTRKYIVEYKGTPGVKSYKEISSEETAVLSHEVDHVKTFSSGRVLLEIEWNNKDPFFDRDLENFKRLHADGAASFGIIITRGKSFQDNIERVVGDFAENVGIGSIADLQKNKLSRTERQRKAIPAAVQKCGGNFARGWANAFVSDKYGAATTHWAKLDDRISRGVGSPSPLVAIGIPINAIDIAK